MATVFVVVPLVTVVLWYTSEYAVSVLVIACAADGTSCVTKTVLLAVATVLVAVAT